MPPARRSARVLTPVLALVCATGPVACTNGGGAASSAPTAGTPATSGTGATTSAPVTGPVARGTASDARTEAAPEGSGSPGAEPGEQAAFPADTRDDGGTAHPGSGPDPGGPMHVTALRTASHPGYDRVVVELSTASVPDWHVGYSEPTGPGGGPAAVDGDAFLRLSLTTEARAGVQLSASAPGAGAIAQARTTGFFEGHEEVLVGIRGGRLPFRAFSLTDPGRIVIDVRAG